MKDARVDISFRAITLMFVASYLKRYLEEVSKLPSEIKGALEEVASLDEMTAFEQSLASSIHRDIENNYSGGDEMRNDDFEKLFDQLKQHLTNSVALTEKKIDIAQRLYDIVDQEIARLDKDLKRFEQNHVQNDVLKITPGSRASTYKLSKGEGDQEQSLIQLDMPVDPNEPVYCFCQQVSYGSMIMCDNDNCPYEWFHFPCVGLVDQVKGKWYCPQCRPFFIKAGHRKKSTPKR